MVTKREMRKRIALVREDLRELEAALKGNRWEDAAGECMNVQGDICIVIEGIEERTGGEYHQ